MYAIPFLRRINVNKIKKRLNKKYFFQRDTSFKKASQIKKEIDRINRRK
jgi:hypothetical protein